MRGWCAADSDFVIWLPRSSVSSDEFALGPLERAVNRRSRAGAWEREPNEIGLFTIIDEWFG